MTITYNCIIVDDEQDSREIISSFLQNKFPEINIVAQIPEVKSAIKSIDTVKPDIVFLDIQLLNGTGFDVLSGITYKNAKVIFITAYDNFAIRAIKYSASNYILKPLEMQEFCEAVEKTIAEIKQENTSNQQLQFLVQNVLAQKNYNTIAIPTSKGLQFVDINTILYLEAKNNYTIFHLANNEKLTVSKTLKEYEDVLTPLHFYRIHHSYIVNLQCIKAYTKGRGGHITISNGEAITVSENRRIDFLNIFEK